MYRFDSTTPESPTRFGPIVVDFDGTLTKEQFMIQWTLFMLLRSQEAAAKKLAFLLRSLFGGPASVWLSRFPSKSERAVRLAYNAFRDADAQTLSALVNDRPFWKHGFALNLNRRTLAILKHLVDSTQTKSSHSAKVVIWSQGSPKKAIALFLQRQDVSRSLINSGIHVDLTDSDAILANQLIVKNERFTGQLQPPVLTKFNRLHLLPPNAIFVGDNKDQAAFSKSGIKPVRFVNCQKITDKHVEQSIRDFVETMQPD